MGGLFLIPDTPILASAEPVVSPDLISTVLLAARPVETYSPGPVSETSVSPVDSCRGLVVSLNLSEGYASCRPPGSVSLDGLESGEGACPRTPAIHTLSYFSACQESVFWHPSPCTSSLSQCEEAKNASGYQSAALQKKTRSGLLDKLRGKASRMPARPRAAKKSQPFFPVPFIY